MYVVKPLKKYYVTPLSYGSNKNIYETNEFE